MMLVMRQVRVKVCYIIVNRYISCSYNSFYETAVAVAQARGGASQANDVFLYLFYKI
jgi:hypothetical protein